MTSVELLDLGLDDVLVLDHIGEVGDVIVFLRESSELTLSEGEMGDGDRKGRGGERDEENMYYLHVSQFLTYELYLTSCTNPLNTMPG